MDFSVSLPRVSTPRILYSSCSTIILFPWNSSGHFELCYKVVDIIAKLQCYHTLVISTMFLDLDHDNQASSFICEQTYKGPSICLISRTSLARPYIFQGFNLSYE